MNVRSYNTQIDEFSRKIRFCWACIEYGDASMPKCGANQKDENKMQFENHFVLYFIKRYISDYSNVNLKVQVEFFWILLQRF